MPNIVVSHLTKKYPKAVKETLSDSNFTIANGEFWAIIGPSGCGKSTFLRMLAGLEPISGGTISVDNKVINKLPPQQRKMAMVFQDYALYPHMNVYGNMAFNLKMKKKTKKEIETKIKKAANALGLNDLLNRKPAELSGGQRQRVALGRAMVRDPDFFLMDEPLSNLDAKLRVDMRSLIIKLHHQLKTTTIYVTHDQAEAMTMADRILLLNDGGIQQVGTPFELYNAPVNLFVAQFIGSPSMNILKGKLDSGKFSINQSDLDLSHILPDKLKNYQGSILIGFRPESIKNIQVEKETKNKKISNNLNLQGKLNFIEYLGGHSLLSLDMFGQTIIIQTEKNFSRNTDKNFQISIPNNKLFYFDPKSGKNLSLMEEK
ncbi:ABC transporter ATP-binding protein [Oenococcus oeni]|uniref:Carbohydrate ABC transporter ATP-binding protein, CUT1 family n=4 Tax=Oenococcus oeni TaxID=1247 RepID=Q04HP8_OENOB|nr:ABC transporter ATP-binding protein [Oenococcus oeni]ABJ56024.1 carbohydrate ABC transporter ATP-binding protein, CUT1 family [Oenococcus oeni PSU-1]OIK66992.1 sugar ABC transporter ATP-binding protein [Oenococcus oeni]OIL16240.1 sugar ABC transporter ATP-binding protein [Oenococcus oeni]OIL31186.1 sugar ABC transporter ATP-binding protein [Oenococcus oeni]OIL83110.1 sugar ABC transporter ATP-binding protein [Oenococcus oeni]